MNRSIGTVLAILPFKERDQVITIFSPQGLIKLFVKKKRSALTTVLTEAEFVFSQKKTDLGRFHDGTILDQHLRLRERYENLEIAGTLIKSILKSQWIDKPAPQLYHLFSLFLKKIPTVDTPETLIPFFLIKLLKHEGVFQLADQCSICENPSNYRFGGERFCSIHASKEAIIVDNEQEAQLIQIYNTRSLNHNLSQYSSDLIHLSKKLFDQEFN